MKLYVGQGCKIIRNGGESTQNKVVKEQFTVPESQIVVLHCADVLQQYSDVIQVQ